jgi:putative ABC transport system permease protein
MLILFRLALFSLKSRAVTSGLIICSVVLSVFLLVGVDRIQQGARAGLSNAFSQTDLVVGARGDSLPLLFYAMFHAGPSPGEISYTSYEHFRDHPAVQWTIPFSIDDGYQGYRVVATDENFYEHYRFHGDRSLQFADGMPPEDIFDVVLGNEAAHRLGYYVGSKINLGRGQEGVRSRQDNVKPFTVTGVLTRTSTPIDNTIYITLSGQEAIHLNSAADTENLHIQSISTFLVRTRSQIDTQLLQHEINHYHDEPLTAVVPALALQEIWPMLGYVDMALSLMSGVALIVSLLAMLAVPYATLNERKKEVAVLRAVGFHARQIFLLFVLESTLLGTAGLAFGLAAAYGSLWMIRFPVEERFGVHLAMAGISLHVSLYACGVILAGALMGCVPAMRACWNSSIDGLNAQ